ncbi:MAG: FeoB-associated Cys-rich membrane protein [Eubacterium sp.]|nr:FeoB-associated Cys-rich membrane protein [Eubacterium sp.]
MISWILANMGSIIVSIILILIVGFILFKMIHDKKSGKSSCSSGCAGCPMSGKCHK